MKFRAAGVVQNSTVDGLGLRQAVFFQGCEHHCKGCHNKHTWSFTGGYEEDTDNIIKAYREDELLSGVTLTGGDPLYQLDAAVEIARRVKELGGNVWCYTGFVYEDLVSLDLPDISKFLSLVDVLVDGPFMLELKDPLLLWRGSSNQRVLQLKDGDIIGTIG